MARTAHILQPASDTRREPEVLPRVRGVDLLQAAVGFGLLLVGGTLVASAVLVLAAGLGVLAAAGAMALGFEGFPR